MYENNKEETHLKCMFPHMTLMLYHRFVPTIANCTFNIENTHYTASLKMALKWSDFSNQIKEPNVCAFFFNLICHFDLNHHKISSSGCISPFSFCSALFHLFFFSIYASFIPACMMWQRRRTFIIQSTTSTIRDETVLSPVNASLSSSLSRYSHICADMYHQSLLTCSTLTAQWAC